MTTQSVHQQLDIDLIRLCEKKKQKRHMQAYRQAYKHVYSQNTQYYQAAVIFSVAISTFNKVMCPLERQASSLQLMILSTNETHCNTKLRYCSYHGLHHKFMIDVRSCTISLTCMRKYYEWHWQSSCFHTASPGPFLPATHKQVER